MKTSQIKSVICGLLSIMSCLPGNMTTLHAQVADNNFTGKEHISENTAPTAGEFSWSIIPLPLLFYTTETQFMGGAMVMVSFGGDAVSGTKPDIITFYGVYTQLKQVLTGIAGTSRFFEDRLMFKYEFKYDHFPGKFFGIGPRAPEQNREYFTPDDIQARLYPLVKITPGLYAGPACDLSHHTLSKTETWGLLESGTIPGSRGGMVSGLGAAVVYDTRDNIYSPYRGRHLELRVLQHHRSLGSDYNFTTFGCNYRSYHVLTGEHVIALQTYLVFHAGTVPFQYMKPLGGQSFMRGYYMGRYRDKNTAAFQTEYRFTIYERFRGAVFGGIAQVAPALRDFSPEELKLAMGLGLRFTVYREKRVNLRLDFAVNDFRFGEESYGIYFSILEAF